jgi:hypothetical protein
MTVASGEVLRVSARQQYANGQDLINVWFWQAAFTSDQTDQDVIDGILAELDNGYAQLNGITSNTISTVDVKIDVVEWVGGKLDTIRSLGTVLWDNTFYAPGSSGDVLPPGVAGLLKFTTIDGKVYGRKFFGGLSEAAQNDGVLSGAALTSLANFAASILSPFVISTGNQLIARVMSSKYADVMLIYEGVANAVVAYQRRRRQGTGS